VSEQDYSKITGQLQRARDLYRVHDSAGKHKKQGKERNEKEFLEMLEESEKNVEEFDSGRKKVTGPQAPTSNMLNRLSSSAPPPVIETDHDESD